MSADDDYDRHKRMVENALKDEPDRNRTIKRMNRPKHKPRGPHGIAGDWPDRLTYTFDKLSLHNELAEIHPDELIAKLMNLYSLEHPDIAYTIIQEGIKKHVIVKKKNGMLTKAHS
jgi:hypothetical protein